MKRMLEYLWLWWKTIVLTHQVNRIISQQEKIMVLMSDVVTLAATVSGKLDTLLAQAPVATQEQVNAVNDTLTKMDGQLNAALPPAPAPAPAP